MKVQVRRLTQLSVIIGLLCHGAQAATNNCNVTNVHYVEGNTLQVPCVEVGESLFNATFKILPNNLWELIQATPVSETRSGARSSFQNNALKLPLVQLTDGSLWEALVQLTGQKSATGNLLFQLTGGKKLTATTDLGKVVFRIGNKTDVRRANANANSNANKDKDKDNGNAQNNTNNGNSGNGNSGNNGNQAPQNITAAVLKVDHIELTGSAKTDLKVSGEIDLLKVISGEPQLLGEVVLPANTHISQVRLILADGSYVIADGEKYPLEIPSGEQTGLKIHGDWGVTGGQITSVQLDFNADDIRFNKAQGYRIKPTVKVASVALQALPTDSSGNPTDNLLTGKPFVLTVGDELTGLKFELPVGAYSNPEKLFGEVTATGLISPIYELGPDKSYFTENGTVTIHYDETKIPKEYTEENIVMLRDGRALASLVNTRTNTVSAQTNHFSCYVATPVHSCNFVDVNYSDPTQEWMSTSIRELCRDSVVQGYSLGDGSWKYEPQKEATLLEVLKVLLSTTRGNCTRYIEENSATRIISDASKILPIQELDLDKPVTREKAITFLSTLHYEYFNSDAVERMKLIGITNGERLNDNISRAELTKIAQKSRFLAERVYYGNDPLVPKISYFSVDGNLTIQTVNADISKLRDYGITEYTIPDNINVVDIKLNSVSIWNEIRQLISNNMAVLSKDNKGRYFLSLTQGNMTERLETGTLSFLFKSGHEEQLTFLPTSSNSARRNPKISIHGHVRECIYNPDYDFDAWFFTGDLTMWNDVEGAKVETAVEGVEKTAWTDGAGDYSIVYQRDTVCETNPKVTATHPVSHKYLEKNANLECWGWNTGYSAISFSFMNGITVPRTEPGCH